METFLYFNAKDLIKLGITKMGPRLKILKAIQDYRSREEYDLQMPSLPPLVNMEEVDEENKEEETIAQEICSLETEFFPSPIDPLFFGHSPISTPDSSSFSSIGDNYTA